MVKEEERRGEEVDEDFKRQLYIQNPKLYTDLYEKPDPENMEVEQITPLDENEMKEALADMRRQGLIS